MKRRIYTATEVAYIERYYANSSTAAIAKALNRSLTSVYNKAFSLGLVKSETYLQTESSGRIQKGQRVGKGTEFKKGHVPLNKGLKQTEYMSAEAIEKTKNTRFKKGNVPHNTKYDGAESVRDGYVWIRIKKGVWKLKQRHVWEEANGPIPDGGNIVFMDGNSHNCELSNLKLVMNEELMEQNTIHRYPDEVKNAIKMVNKLNRKINDYGKE